MWEYFDFAWITCSVTSIAFVACLWSYENNIKSNEEKSLHIDKISTIIEIKYNLIQLWCESNKDAKEFCDEFNRELHKAYRLDRSTEFITFLKPWHIYGEDLEKYLMDYRKDYKLTKVENKKVKNINTINTYRYFADKGLLKVYLNIDKDLYRTAILKWGNDHIVIPEWILINTAILFNNIAAKQEMVTLLISDIDKIKNFNENEFVGLIVNNVSYMDILYFWLAVGSLRLSRSVRAIVK